MAPGFLYALGAAVTWGAVYAIDQKLLAGTSALTLLIASSVITAVAMLPFIWWDYYPVKDLLVSKFNFSLIILSLVLAALANWLIFSSIKSIGASSASIIEIAYPLFVVIFSVIFFSEAPSVPLAIGGLFVFIGSGIIVYFHSI